MAKSANQGKTVVLKSNGVQNVGIIIGVGENDLELTYMLPGPPDFQNNEYYARDGYTTNLDPSEFDIV